MRIQCIFSAFVLLSFTVASAPAADLSRIERTIAKEPAYKTKGVKYALLVFGPEAKDRVWLVIDGETLYVDKNGNGDLTDEGEKVGAEKNDRSDAADGEYSFKVDELRTGRLVHKSLDVCAMKLDRFAEREEIVKALLTKNPGARGYLVSADVDMPGWKGAGIGGRVGQGTFPWDAHGVLQFADRPQDAPIIHFGGPRQIALFGPHQLRIGRDNDLVLGVGTPGVGPGSTVWTEYGIIPENAFPVAEITYASAKAGAPPVRERFELKQRC